MEILDWEKLKSAVDDYGPGAVSFELGDGTELDIDTIETTDDGTAVVYLS